MSSNHVVESPWQMFRIELVLSHYKYVMRNSGTIFSTIIRWFGTFKRHVLWILSRVHGKRMYRFHDGFIRFFWKCPPFGQEKCSEIFHNAFSRDNGKDEKRPGVNFSKQCNLTHFTIHGKKSFKIGNRLTIFFVIFTFFKQRLQVFSQLCYIFTHVI